MEAAWKSSLYLKNDWIERVLEDYEDEVDNASTWTMILLKREARTAVWNVCQNCGVSVAGGLPGHACLLLERYLAICMQQKATTVTSNADWEDFKRGLWSRMPLLIASCVQLATKMTSATVSVHPKVIRTSLLQKGLDYSVMEIISSEFHVFSTIGFRVPLWTSVDVAQLMAVQVGMPASLLDRLALIINISEYHRDLITERVCNMGSGFSPSAFNMAKLCTLHLAAGAVVASARFLNYVIHDLSPRLSKLTRAPLRYIVIICNIIMSLVLHVSDCNSDAASDSETTSITDADSNSMSESDEDSIVDYVVNKRFKFSF